MGMANGVGTGSTVSAINVTPLIDVLLVLLIIFMVIVPVAPKGLGATVPQAPRDDAPQHDDAVVVSIAASGSGEPVYRINQQPVAKAAIEPTLVRIFSARQRRTMFVRADESLDYRTVAEVIDMAHGANVDTVGLMTPGLEAGR